MKEEDNNTVLFTRWGHRYSLSELDDKQEYDGSEEEEYNFYSLERDDHNNRNEGRRMKSSK
jgi:hypothetical protein